MRFKRLLCTTAVVMTAALSVASAESGRCENNACCDEAKACCTHNTAKPDAIGILLGMDQQPSRPAREAVTVWFHRPVRVGDRILFGKYVIQHDNDRMARGEPCTHIYAASDQQQPVVAFHCTHLDRPTSTNTTVMLRRTEPDGISKLAWFQFAGETGAHGVPPLR